jgi:hypothetical protein
VLLGLARDRATAPLEFTANDPRLTTPDLGVMFSEAERNPESESRQLPIEPGLYLAHLPGADDGEAAIPEEIMERLKALGYVSETTPR